MRLSVSFFFMKAIFVLLGTNFWLLGTEVNNPSTLAQALPFEQPYEMNQLLSKQGKLELGDSTLENGSFYDVYTFKGQAGQSVVLTIASAQFDARIILLNPQGQQLQETDSFSMSLSLPHDGFYQVLVTVNASFHRRKVSEFPDGFYLFLWTIDQSEKGNQGTYYLTVTPTSIEQRSSPNQLEEFDGEAFRLNRAGLLRYLTSQFQDALDISQHELEVRQAIDDRVGEGCVLNNLGMIYRKLGQYSRALEYYQQALTLRQEIGDSFGEGSTLNNIGALYNDLGQYSQALQYLQEALVVLREAKSQALFGSTALYGSTLLNTGEVYYELEQYTQALKYYQNVLELHFESEDSRIASVLMKAESYNHLGAVYNKIGQYSQALQHYQDALRIYESFITNGAFGATHDEAALYEVATIFKGIGTVYANLGQYSQALEHQQQALAFFQEMGDRRGEGSVLTALGAIAFDTDKFSDSTAYLLKASEILESLRANLADTDKVSLFETTTLTYRYLQRALIAQNEIDKALESAERGRARAFVEQLAQRLGSQETAEALIAANIPTLEQIKRIAQVENSTLVEYSIVSDEELYIWVVKPTGEIEFESVDLKALNVSLADLVDLSRESIGVTRSPFVVVRPRVGTEQEPLAQQTQRLRQLHQTSIEPIAKYLPTDANAPVIFIPQNQLFLVPFAALQNASGVSLIDQHTILTSPSIQVLEKTQQQAAKVKQANLRNVLIVGNPTMPSVPPAIGEPVQQLPPLPGAKAEASAIAPLFNTQALTENQAKESTVVQRMPNARIIHLATHGLFDGLFGLNSAIALAPDGDGELDDGLLTAAEIAQMNLHAELVVLSACNTGQGQITGDGVIGLSRSLITAGVPSVIVSIWSVPDAPTADLMREFYRQFEQTGDKAQALRQAMIATRATHPNPRDWAAFTLIGEAR